MALALRSVVRSRSAAVALCMATAAGCARSSGAVPPNMALGRPVAVSAVGPDAGVITDGRLAPEAAAPGSAATPLATVQDFAIVDLGAVQPVGAILLQADAADVYFVEVSADGAAWQVAWRVEPLAGASGLHARHSTLFEPAAARFIRARTTTARSAAISEIQAFASAPAAWPPEDRSAAAAHRPLFPVLGRDRTNALYGALAALLIAAAAFNLLARRMPAESAERRRGRRALVAVAVAAFLAWPNFLNFHYYGFVHTWEFFHYYMGAKYLPELGYTCLYTAAAAVDAEDGIDTSRRLMRDLRDNQIVPTDIALQRAGECKSGFTAERWARFRDDARFFRGEMGAETWFGVRNDHGFNGTPAWSVAAGLLARMVPASRTSVVALALLDVVLILVLFPLLGARFGLEAACIAAGFWGLNALAPFGWTGGGFLRYDWLFWLIVAIAALARGRSGIAGFALGYATLLRIFPVCAIAGLALKALVEAASARSHRPLLRHAAFAAGVAAAVVVFGLGSALLAGRAGIWRDFATNSAKHLATPSSNLVGFEAALSYESAGRLELMTDPLLVDRHAPWKARLAMVKRAMAPSRWLGAALFVLLLALAVRGAPEWAAAVLGLGLMPMLFLLSSYYYCALIAFAALVILRPWTGLALAGLAWATLVIASFWASPDAQYAAQSVAVVAFVVGVTGAFAWSARGRPLDDNPA